MSSANISQPVGLCACGCGGQTRTYAKEFGGATATFIRGHQHRVKDWRERLRRHRQRWVDAELEYGQCLCGCGGTAPISGETQYARGWIKGEPRLWIGNHAQRSGPEQYSIEDRGHETPCWVWQLSRIRQYGQVRGGLAHRVFYERYVGPIPAGLHLDHLCRVPLCVNPEHLEPVTQTENNRRQVNQKLTLAEARAIRSEYAGWQGSGIGFCRMVAERHGMAHQTIDALVRGLTWKEAA